MQTVASLRAVANQFRQCGLTHFSASCSLCLGISKPEMLFLITLAGLVFQFFLLVFCNICFVVVVFIFLFALLLAQLHEASAWSATHRGLTAEQ